MHNGTSFASAVYAVFLREQEHSSGEDDRPSTESPQFLSEFRSQSSMRGKKTRPGDTAGIKVELDQHFAYEACQASEP